MAKEQDQANAAQADQTGDASQQAAPQKEGADDAAAQAGQQVDWEKRYKDSQAELTKANQDLSRANQMLDLVDWNQAGVPPGQGQGATPGTTEEESSETVTKKTLLDTLSNQERTVDAKLGVLNFRMKHPDLVPYENTLFVGVLNQTHKKYKGRKPMDEVMDEAANTLRTTLENERKKGAEEADKKKKEAAGAGGLGSAGATTPKKDTVTQEQSYDDYMKERKELQEKRLSPS